MACEDIDPVPQTWSKWPAGPQIRQPQDYHDITFECAPDGWLMWCRTCRRGFNSAVEYVASACGGEAG